MPGCRHKFLSSLCGRSSVVVPQSRRPPVFVPFLSRCHPVVALPSSRYCCPVVALLSPFFPVVSASPSRHYCCRVLVVPALFCRCPDTVSESSRQHHLVVPLSRYCSVIVLSSSHLWPVDVLSSSWRCHAAVLSSSRRHHVVLPLSSCRHILPPRAVVPRWQRVVWRKGARYCRAPTIVPRQKLLTEEEALFWEVFFKR